MKIFINLPVKDLTKTNAFYQALGFEFNPNFSGEAATCMQINNQAWVMLLTEAYFKTFIKKEICDATRSTEVLVAIDQNSKAEVDEFLNKVLSIGGTEARDLQDLGFMYSRAFNDPDGHIWEVFWMDPSQIPDNK
ncbi:MAG: hypothetical protein RL161_729 [Bacteroidota bacterium]|jgi:predicted lactoylglutathione lyase